MVTAPLLVEPLESGTAKPSLAGRVSAKLTGGLPSKSNLANKKLTQKKQPLCHLAVTAPLLWEPLGGLSFKSIQAN